MNQFQISKKKFKTAHFSQKVLRWQEFSIYQKKKEGFSKKTKIVSKKNL